MSPSRLFLLLSVAVLVSCGVAPDRFRLEGRFRNINQGELYLCNYRNGTKDTLKIMDGRFGYEAGLADTAVFVLLFPNFSELPLIAQPGSVIKIEGDVSHLKETIVEGTEENEQLTEFRMNTNELMPPEVKEKAGEYIAEHSTSLSSVYLLRRYFIQNVTPDYENAYNLCAMLLDAQPTNVELVQLKQLLGRLRNMRTEGKLPHFKAKDTKGKTVGDSLLRKKVNVIMAWATWEFDSQSIIRQVKQLYDDHPRDLGVMTICLNASESEGRHVFARDSLTWPDICDGLMWDSPVVTSLGLAFVPDNIISDADGKIIARSLKNTDLREKLKELLE